MIEELSRIFLAIAIALVVFVVGSIYYMLGSKLVKWIKQRSAL